jgi:hypothetical protein
MTAEIERVSRMSAMGSRSRTTRSAARPGRMVAERVERAQVGGRLIGGRADRLHRGEAGAHEEGQLVVQRQAGIDVGERASVPRHHADAEA